MARNRNDVSTPEVTWLSRGQNTKIRGGYKKMSSILTDQ
jgi:hypothetical protein